MCLELILNGERFVLFCIDLIISYQFYMISFLISWFLLMLTCFFILRLLLVRPICQTKSSKLYLEWKKKHSINCQDGSKTCWKRNSNCSRLNEWRICFFCILIYLSSVILKCTYLLDSVVLLVDRTWIPMHERLLSACNEVAVISVQVWIWRCMEIDFWFLLLNCCCPLQCLHIIGNEDTRQWTGLILSFCKFVF